MQELKEKIDLILKSQVVMQKEVLKINSKIDMVDEKFEKKFEETNQRIDQLDEKFEKKFVETNQKIDSLEGNLGESIEEISDMFRNVLESISA